MDLTYHITSSYFSQSPSLNGNPISTLESTRRLLYHDWMHGGKGGKCGKIKRSPNPTRLHDAVLSHY